MSTHAIIRSALLCLALAPALSACEGGELAPPAECRSAGDPLALRAPAVVIEGRVTVAPAEVPWAAAIRVEATSALGLAYAAEADAEGRYRLEVPAGRYDVSARFVGEGCSAGCLAVPIVEDREIGADAVLDARVEAAPVAGVLTLDGREPPRDEAMGRGALVFSDPALGAVYALPIAEDGPAAFRGWLPVGRRHAIEWVTEARRVHAFGEPVRPLPLGAAALGQVTVDGPLEGLVFDARSVVIDLAIRVEGRPLADDGIADGRGRGEVRLGDGWRVDLGERGDHTALRVFPGEYPATLVAASAADQDALPRLGGGLYGCPTHGADGWRSGCDFSAAGPVAADFLTRHPGSAWVAVSGGVRLVDAEGRAVALEGCDVRVVLRGDGRRASGAVDTGGRFEVQASRGVHAVTVVAGGGAPGCPVGGAVVRGALAVEGPIAGLEVEAAVAPARVELTVDGWPMPDNGALGRRGRGWVTLVPEGGEAADGARFDLGDTGPAVLAFDALVGAYDVRLDTVEPGRLQVETPLPQDVLPATSRRVGGLRVGPDGGAAALDLRVVTVRGIFAADAAVDAAGDDGARWLRFVSESDGHRVWAEVGEGGAFEARLFADGYGMALGDRFDVISRVETVTGHAMLDLACD